MDQQDYCKLAKIAAKELNSAGFIVEYVDHVDVVKVTVEGGVYYVNLEVSHHNNYGSSLKSYTLCIMCEGRYFSHIILRYENHKECTIFLDTHFVNIRGESYCKVDGNKYYGHLVNNAYMEYGLRWIKDNTFNSQSLLLENFNRLIKQLNRDKYMILDLDFNPSKYIQINIKNETPKVILQSYKTNSYKTFTVFDEPFEYIVDGIYEKSGRDDLFKYITPDGELFALLLDPITKEVTLASVMRIFKLTKISNYLAKKEGNLYNGYEIISSGLDSIAPIDPY
jgi:hypothetical protein